MSTRPGVVTIVRQCAFEGLTSTTVPDDATPMELAEGLISEAMRRLSAAAGKEAAFDVALAIVHRYKDAANG